jgi:two-component system response regulator YesN
MRTATTRVGASTEPRAVRQAKAYVLEHLTEPVSTRHVAAHVGLNERYFCRLFKQAAGMTLMHYLSAARLRRAKQLLHDPDLRVKEVAHAAGFNSLSHFHHVFAQTEGTTPRQYQVNLRQ